MTLSCTVREGLVIAGLALLVEEPAKGAVPVADAVDLLRSWAGVSTGVNA